MITASITYLIRRRRSDFTQTNALIDKIVRLTVQNGLITALFSIISLVLFLGDVRGGSLIVGDLPMTHQHSLAERVVRLFNVQRMTRCTVEY